MIMNIKVMSKPLSMLYPELCFSLMRYIILVYIV